MYGWVEQYLESLNSLDDQEGERGQREGEHMAEGEQRIERMGTVDSSSQIFPT